MLGMRVETIFKKGGKMKLNKRAQLKKDERSISVASLDQLEKFVREMRPSGKVNDIHAIRLLLLGIISQLKTLHNKKCRLEDEE